jgi:hypothetical protein
VSAASLDDLHDQRRTLERQIRAVDKKAKRLLPTGTRVKRSWGGAGTVVESDAPAHRVMVRWDRYDGRVESVDASTLKLVDGDA